MSIYSEISKRIGWEGQCSIPTEQIATELLKAVEKRDERSFEIVFKIHRFAPTPDTSNKVQTMNIINKAFRIGTTLFS